MKCLKRIPNLLFGAVLCLYALTGCQTGIPGEDETKESFVNPYETEAEVCLAHHFIDGICSQCETAYAPSEGLDYCMSDDCTGYLVNGMGGCKDTQIIIPDTYEGLPVWGLAPMAFRENSELTYVHLPEGATGIGEWSLQDCVNLRRVEIPATVNHIGREAFSGCIRLSEVTIPEGIQIISNAAFQDCANLAVVHLPTTLTVIDDNAFLNCRSITEITIPAGVVKINGQAFKNCDGLTAVRYGGNIEDWCCIEFDYDHANPVVTAKHLYLGDQLVEGVLNIPEGVVHINRQALMGISDITAIILPESLRTTGSFERCEKLDYIVFKSTPTRVGDTRMFENTALTHVYLSDTKEEAVSYIAYISVACKNVGAEFHYSDQWHFDENNNPVIVS